MVYCNLPGTFYHNIICLRKKYYLSRQAFAALTGMKVYTLRAIELQCCRPDVDASVVRNICRIFCITTETLIHANLVETDYGKP